MSKSASECSWGHENFTALNIVDTPTLYFEIILYPILLIVCTFGNFVIVVVLTMQREMKSPDVYMIGLAISDTFVL